MTDNTQATRPVDPLMETIAATTDQTRTSPERSTVVSTPLHKTTIIGHAGHHKDTLLDDLGATISGDIAVTPVSGAVPYAGEFTTTQNRTTVLPRVEACKGEPVLTMKRRERYKTLRALGHGGVGEVLLVQDNDIERQVAMKRIKPSARSEASLMRFAEEIRTVGQLDHPNIVPIHDVGVDDDGQHFFIMKHVSGETLEEIILKLQENDLAYHQRFTFEVRTQLFMELMRGLQFAHNQKIIHRDIKPANIIVGPYGEVTLMDWGLAKKVEGEANDVTETWLSQQPVPDPVDMVEEEGGSSSSRRLIKTEYGAILGTPAYLSPEQAQGEIDTIDQRSDIYSLCVLFYELLSLRHYLPNATTLTELMVAIVQSEPDNPAFIDHPVQGPVPAPLAHFVMKGLAKNPEDRYDSIETMMQELRMIQEGRHHVQCSITLAKRLSTGLSHTIDQHPRITAAVVMSTPFIVVGSVIAAAVAALS